MFLMPNTKSIIVALSYRAIKQQTTAADLPLPLTLAYFTDLAHWNRMDTGMQHGAEDIGNQLLNMLWNTM